MKKISPRNYLFKMLTRREHSVMEVREKMQKKFPEEIEQIEALIEEFKKENWVSDARFCEAFVRDQILKKSGPRKMAQKLMQKGIKIELISEKIKQEYPPAEQLEVIIELAKKKYVSLKNQDKEASDFELQQKILRFLIGRGFDFDMAKKAAKNTANE